MNSMTPINEEVREEYDQLSCDDCEYRIKTTRQSDDKVTTWFCRLLITAMICIVIMCAFQMVNHAMLFARLAG